MREFRYSFAVLVFLLIPGPAFCEPDLTRSEAVAAIGVSTDAQSPAAAPPAPPPPPSLTVKIDLSNQRMVVAENGITRYTWPISSGRAGYRTPNGTFRPTWTAKMHYSRKYDWSPMPHSVFFHKGFAIHGTAYVGRLGAPASHGCIRLAPGNAKTFYNLVGKHGNVRTRIAISGSPRDRAPAVARRNSYDPYAYAYAPPPRRYGSVSRSRGQRYGYAVQRTGGGLFGYLD